jgi:hypothetical protein
MKTYTKNGQIKQANRIVVRITKEVNGEQKTFQVINPTEEMILADGWELYVTPEPTIDDYRRDKIREITRYDSSSDVNCFYINGQDMWLDKATRVGLKLRFDAEIASGQTNTTLWYEGTPFNIELANAVQMLNAIELYASACYDNTQMHIANVNTLNSIDSIEDYDYKQGYPEKLKF